MDKDIIKAALEMARKKMRDEMGSKLFSKKPSAVTIIQHAEEESPAEEKAESPEMEAEEDAAHAEPKSGIHTAIAEILAKKKKG